MTTETGRDDTAAPLAPAESRIGWRRVIRFVFGAWILPCTVVLILLSWCIRFNEAPVLQLSGDFATLSDNVSPRCLNVTPALEYFFDEQDAYTIDKVAHADAKLPFRAFNADSVNMGFVGVPVWLRLRLHNTASQDKRLIFEMNNPRIARVEFYANAGTGNFNASVAGAAADEKEREIRHPAPAYALEVPAQSQRTFYLHVVNSGSFRFVSFLWEPSVFQKRMAEWRAGILVFMGALLAMTIYHLAVCIMLRESSYLYLALMTGFFCIYQAARSGIGPLLIWPNSPYWSTHSVVTLIMLVTASATFFADSFLGAHKTNPRLSAFLRLLGWCNVICGFFGLTDLMLKYYLSHFLGVITAVLVSVVVIWQLRMGSRHARIFIGGWGLTMLSAVMFALVGPGVLPSNLVTENFVEIAMMSTAVLCSTALADRIKVREAEQRAALELAVKVRTQELQQALDQVKTLSGLLPICSHCKKIRDDGGYWNSLEKYLYEHTDALLSHGICPECAHKHYPEIFGPDGQPRQPKSA